MVEDVPARFYHLHLNDIELIHLGLTYEQIQEHNPPPAFAKETDANYKWYVEETGLLECWELDALPPETLLGLLQDKIQELVDIDKYSELLEQKETERTQLYDLSHKPLDS